VKRGLRTLDAIDEPAPEGPIPDPPLEPAPELPTRSERPPPPPPGGSRDRREERVRAMLESRGWVPKRTPPEPTPASATPEPPASD